MNGVNSRQKATHKLKGGTISIEGNKFRLPLVYAFDMRTGDGIDMLIDISFIRSMNGGIQIEGNEITFYKKVTKIQTTPQTEVTNVAIEELELDEYIYHEVQNDTLFTKEEGTNLHEEFRPILDRLKQQGYVGENPLLHWKKNQELCRIEVINPEITIQDKPPKNITPAMEASFKRHIDALLKLEVIRPSSSRHRTMAMIVNSGTTVDLKTGKETKGINTLLKRIGSF
ncbi:uncharacterized protein LOC112504925 [Cynara cardunculus var. scolymus]|uniref:uncharacterized protein LOC112504925 n=1 Tax=Cynara cardunculus var. scolymus TaxID=59895 RepID=UPI000D627AC8|nr:uncharacterized protein LOC112504925 [Cynara cardunculus var. scolymus]